VLDFFLSGPGPLSAQLNELGFDTFAAVAEHVRGLPYGRIPACDDAMAVIRLQRGTCSSKHRLLAAVAHECGHTDVALTVGLYEMSERNTPGVGAVLAAAGLQAIPEAHCYLTYQEKRYDFTGLPAGHSSPFDSLIEERAMTPDTLPGDKARYHQEAIRRWAQARGLDPAPLWHLREQCIALLARQTSPRDQR
jgi:hypothetical protein